MQQIEHRRASGVGNQQIKGNVLKVVRDGNVVEIFNDEGLAAIIAMADGDRILISSDSK